jgi:glycogen debranching enzyme
MTGTLEAERLRIGNDFYLLAGAVPIRGRQLVLNHGDSFAVLNELGDCPLTAHEPFGVLCDGTRFLDRFELRINGGFPQLLSAGLTDDNSEQVSYLTNADEQRGDTVIAQRGSLAIERRKVLAAGMLHEALHVRNYAAAPFELTLTLLFSADFADIFELRGMSRPARGSARPARVQDGQVELSYRGLDGVERAALLRFAPAQRWQLQAESASLACTLAAGEELRATIALECRVAARSEPRRGADRAAALAQVRDERQAVAAWFPRIVSSNAAFDEWLDASRRDVALLHARLPSGGYVYAGIPWFATVFGRDGLLTALETLAFAPQLAAGTLRVLAATQGRVDDAWREEAPGKIVHELRGGEMAATGEVPFGRYYGSVDATPLFAALLAAYVERTGDLALARELWPTALAAMQWIERSVDARGYLAYARRGGGGGLVNQGWKDSHDSISHADGALAEAPIALCEVQGYVYAAQSGMAELARQLGETARGAEWARQAQQLRERFARDFWVDALGTYALALDGSGRRCEVVASNAGQCLLSGIASPAHARRIADRLLEADSFSGWGIRTLASGARRFNPMSYHNGSVWPHDNALIAAGFARYGFTERAADVLTALFDSSCDLADRRLPELFCGFARGPGDRPVAYPVACRPQAWAAASVYLCLQAMLGLSIDAARRHVGFVRSALPPWLESLEIYALRVGDAELDLRLARGRHSAAVEVIDKRGDVEITVRG